MIVLSQLKTWLKNIISWKFTWISEGNLRLWSPFYFRSWTSMAAMAHGTVLGSCLTPIQTSDRDSSWITHQGRITTAQLRYWLEWTANRIDWFIELWEDQQGKTQPLTFGPSSVFPGKKEDTENKRDGISLINSGSNMVSTLSSQGAEAGDKGEFK